MVPHLLIRHLLVLAFIFSNLWHVLAQITITYPADRAVFQRNNSNEAQLYVAGYVTEMFDKIEVRLTPLVAGEGQAVPAGGGWQLLDAQVTCGQFYGSINAKGGWYKLEVQGIRAGSQPKVASLAHVGLGEVFVVAGQSNATGGDANPNGPGAKHDQVNSVDFQNYNAASQSIAPYASVQLPCPQFVHLDAGVKTAPFGNYAWCWGAFGDQLYEKLHVPVMIFNAGWSSTGIDNWFESVDPAKAPVSAFGYVFPAGMPFGHLRLALNYYVAQLGIRAVLWHQGETDNYLEQPGDDTFTRYASRLSGVIQATRNLTGKTDLAWMVARASRFTVNGVNRVSANVIAAQNEVISNNALYPHVYPGPDTDPYFSIDYRADQVHFRGDGVTPSADGKVYAGLVSLAQFWSDRVDAAFLSQSVPYAATPPPLVNAVAAPPAEVTFQAPAGSAGTKYAWLSEVECNTPLSANPEFKAGAGHYKLRMTDAKGNVVFSPALNVDGNALPVIMEYFYAQADADNRVTLHWATSAEINAAYFEIERSRDAVHYSTVATERAWGNTSCLHAYTATDEPLEPGIYYYRLRQWDLDGTSHLSRITSLHIGGAEPQVYPNPVTDQLTISAAHSLRKVVIRDASGREVFSADSAGKVMVVDVSRLPAGLYIVEAVDKRVQILK
ncbi:T9SS type A sorting domain-containing protein [Dyadobacter sandarakinus]|uniref:T9SS type A sorting domain-containing protein n=1 Tax=Dyadobacter sandarakinus TaxID=2747268 RepID=A0ABX7I5Q8_9BACT|nr:T9SS type A sorting domain-containing protein [Dyadobacter sandarakinus]QRR01120.1 T9SS type A sorting domain-containing protein [Dyadobacter sandarakinus]